MEERKVEEMSELELKAAGFDLRHQFDLCKQQVDLVFAELARREKLAKEVQAVPVEPSSGDSLT